MSKATASIYQLKITLKGSKPSIWRRVLIASDTTLSDLHDIIQVAMGWDNSHLHAFDIYGQQYSSPMFSSFDPQEMGMKNGDKLKLNRLITKEGEKFLYEYDFGDSWEHQITLEKILPADPKQQLPVCIKGKGACPPEDVGGIWGYHSFLEAIKDPNHPEHEEYLEWLDYDFDPEEFDMDEVNQHLKMFK